MDKKDVSETSMKILENEAERFLKLPLCVPDWGKIYSPSDKNPEVALLMGSYFERIFQKEFWPHEKFDLFCLSPSVRKILIDVFCFDEEVVGCLSRYDLFPVKTINEESYRLQPNSNLFYAGRLSPQKNIEFLILTFFYLQMFYSQEISLVLLGNFDNEYHKDIPGCPYGDYKNKIETLITSLPWAGKKPHIIFGKNEMEWLNFIPENPLFISCSNLISEDFSVTAAQLEQCGKPMILPLWGGLADICAKNVRFYSDELIGHSHEDLKAINRKSKSFAQMIAKENFQIHTPVALRTIYPRKKIDRNYLLQKVEENKKKWGNEIDLLVENLLPAFVVTESGQRVFSECRLKFRQN